MARSTWKVWAERSGKNWRCRWQGVYGDGQNVFVFKDDARECAILKRREFQRRDAGLPPMRTPTGASFGSFRSKYLSWIEQRRSARTLYLAKRALDLYQSRIGAHFPGKEQVRDFSDALLKEYNPNGARIYLRHLKAALRWAHREGMIDYDPFLHFEFPAPVPVARVLKPAEIAAILAELPDDVRRAVFFVLFTGLRLSEVLSLDWANVVRRDGNLYMTVLKSKTRRAKPETKTQAIHRQAAAVMGQERAAGSVFGLKMSKLEQNLRRAVVKLGLGRVRLHDLRHTWATLLQQQARDIRAVMEVGGWSSQSAAMIYQHGTPERQDVTLGLDIPVPIRPLNVDGDGDALRKK